MKILWGGALLIISFLFYPVVASADNEFSTSYDVSYDVGADAVTEVKQKITLKNLTTKYYASNFTLTVGSTTVSDVSASDEGGAMETKVEGKENKTAITVTFNQQVAGMDKTQNFTLRFRSKDFAQVIGKTWEVTIPKVPEGGNIDGYNVVFSVPLSFGDPTSISPQPKSESQSFDRLFFNFSKEQLLLSGVSVNFGTSQVFDFSLGYRLENTSLFPVYTSIPLPPDTQYQNISLTRIYPEPLNVTVDEDGNYLAWYKLARRTKQDITVVGSAKLLVNSNVKKAPLLSASQKRELTKSDQYWEKNNPVILAALSRIFKEETPKTNQEKIGLIYRYVVNTLKYDVSRLNSEGIERLGAVTALNNPSSAVCMEFTDLFVALARAAGIPARELDGFAYSQNPKLRPLSLSKDLLHAWPEYYDEERGWVMVDPTWENTSGGIDYFNKFDLNHLVIAVKGYSSTAPYTSEDVKVMIASTDFIGQPQLSITTDLPDQIWAGLPKEMTVKVTNQGNSVQPRGKFNIKTGRITVLEEKTQDIGPIPPFGTVSLKFNLKASGLWERFIEELGISVDEAQYSKQVEVKPFFLLIPLPYLLGIMGGLLIITYSLVFTIHLLRKKSGKEKEASVPVIPSP